MATENEKWLAKALADCAQEDYVSTQRYKRALARLAAKYAALRERVPFIQAELERHQHALDGSKCATDGCTGQPNSLDDDLRPRCFWCWGNIRREKEGV